MNERTAFERGGMIGRWSLDFVHDSSPMVLVHDLANLGMSGASFSHAQKITESLDRSRDATTTPAPREQFSPRTIRYYYKLSIDA
jgi:hypothetical protein